MIKAREERIFSYIKIDPSFAGSRSKCENARILDVCKVLKPVLVGLDRSYIEDQTQAYLEIAQWLPISQSLSYEDFDFLSSYPKIAEKHFLVGATISLADFAIFDAILCVQMQKRRNFSTNHRALCSWVHFIANSIGYRKSDLPKLPPTKKQFDGRRVRPEVNKYLNAIRAEMRSLSLGERSVLQRTKMMEQMALKEQRYFHHSRDYHIDHLHIVVGTIVGVIPPTSDDPLGLTGLKVYCGERLIPALNVALLGNQTLESCQHLEYRYLHVNLKQFQLDLGDNELNGHRVLVIGNVLYKSQSIPWTSQVSLDIMCPECLFVFAVKTL